VILVDTSIWVGHFRLGSPELQRILTNNEALTHSFVLGELACGQLSKRTETLRWLRLLPAVALARHDDVMDLIERRHLWGRGIGWTDAHLLASALLAGCRLWTQDQRLHAVAVQLGLA
jgi:predicted nucleic acid-binding protein